MEFKDLLDWAKAEALSNTLNYTELSVWREVCRNYSKTFSTPLHLCLDGTILPEDILLAVMEEQLENFDEERDLDNILEQIYKLENIDYEEVKEKALKEFIEETEEREKERLKKGKSLHKALKEEQNQKNTPEKIEESKKSGFLDLSYLSKEEEKPFNVFE